MSSGDHLRPIEPVPPNPSSSVTFERDSQLRRGCKHLQIGDFARMSESCSCCVGSSVQVLKGVGAELSFLMVSVGFVSGNEGYRVDNSYVTRTDNCNHKTGSGLQTPGRVVRRDMRR